MLIRVNEYSALLWLISQDSFSGMHGSHTHSCQVRSQCIQLPTSCVRFLLHHVLFKLTLFYTARENSSLRFCYDKIWRAKKVSINSSVSNSPCRWASFLLLAFMAILQAWMQVQGHGQPGWWLLRLSHAHVCVNISDSLWGPNFLLEVEGTRFCPWN